jgi:hypothetical protein
MIQPTPLSATYRICITSSDFAFPRVFVVDPPLRDLGHKPIPHRYSDGSLCLNLPTDCAVDSSIAEMVVPWTSLWLYYYEMWRATGEWLGGGIHLADRVMDHHEG